jgi:hypothetical protein
VVAELYNVDARGPAIDGGGGGDGGWKDAGEETHSCRLRWKAWGSCKSVWRCQRTVTVLEISERTECMLGNVRLEGTPCIGRARDRNGGRVGRSGTKGGMRPQVGKCGVEVEGEGEGEMAIQRTGEVENA